MKKIARLLILTFILTGLWGCAQKKEDTNNKKTTEKAESNLRLKSVKLPVSATAEARVNTRESLLETNEDLTARKFQPQEGWDCSFNFEAGDYPFRISDAGYLYLTLKGRQYEFGKEDFDMDDVEDKSNVKEILQGTWATLNQQVGRIYEQMILEIDTDSDEGSVTLTKKCERDAFVR